MVLGLALLLVVHCLFVVEVWCVHPSRVVLSPLCASPPEGFAPRCARQTLRCVFPHGLQIVSDGRRQIIRPTPNAIMKFELRTTTNPRVSSSKSSQETRRVALPQSPGVIPTECDPLCGLMRLQIVKPHDRTRVLQDADSDV